MSKIEELRRFEAAFREETKAGDVRHDLIRPTIGVPDAAGWWAFQCVNSPSEASETQEWEVCENGSACGRYEGEPARIALFRDLAAEAYTLLQEVECPQGGTVKLSEQKGHLGWIDVVYRSALSFATIDLRTHFGRWNRTGVFPLDDDDHWVGEMFPLTPTYERLVSGLFRSSAEAIGLWFNPNLSLQVGAEMCDVPVAFTRPYLLPTTPPVSCLEEPPSHQPPRKSPEWNGRVLRCDGRDVKSFACQATACISLLDAFQKAGWPSDLDGSGIDEMEGDDARLGNAIYRVNLAQDVIVFDRNGWGGVRWRWRDKGRSQRQYRGRAKRPGERSSASCSS